MPFLFKGNKAGNLGEKCAVIAGLGGGLLTIAIYMGVPMAGPLSLATQVLGALGVISVLLLAYSHIGK